MREILFRGKRLDTGEWVEGDLWQVPYGGVLIVPPGCISGLEVDPATVGQFTGLHANGKRVFEGDVVKYYDIIVKENLTSRIEWDEDCFVAHEVGGFSAPMLSHISLEDWVEVIGNIHDNPELLEVTPDE